MSASLYSLYPDLLLEQARLAPHRGRLARPDLILEAREVSCGDEARLYLRLEPSARADLPLEQRRIRLCRWQGEGCVISRAALSVLAEACRGQSLAEVRAWSLATMLTLLGLPAITPARESCLMLGVRAFASVGRPEPASKEEIRQP